jgi:hypothetical protein
MSFLFRLLDAKILNLFSNSFISFDGVRTQEFSSTSSAVAHSEYQKTGTHINSASTVQIQKLSFVRFISHEESLIISIIPSGFHHVNMIEFPAIPLRYFSSGPAQIIIRGSCNLLNNLIMVPVSLTKLTSLPTYT